MKRILIFAAAISFATAAQARKKDDAPQIRFVQPMISTPNQFASKQALKPTRSDMAKTQQISTKVAESKATDSAATTLGWETTYYYGSSISGYIQVYDAIFYTPIANANVQIYDQQGQYYTAATTDADGFAYVSFVNNNDEYYQQCYYDEFNNQYTSCNDYISDAEYYYEVRVNAVGYYDSAAYVYAPLDAYYQSAEISGAFPLDYISFDGDGIIEPHPLPEYDNPYVDLEGATDLVAVGAGFGAYPVVQVVDHNNVIRFEALAFEEGFRGGVHVALGDVNGDGVLDVIMGAGRSGGPAVRVIDGKTGTDIVAFFAFEESFRGGVYVSAGDVNGDGCDDIFVGAGETGGPRAQIFSGTGPNCTNPGKTLRNFFPFEDTFRGGVHVSSGDFDGDGVADLVATPGVGGGPRVRIYSGATGESIYDKFVFDPNFRGGVSVSSYDADGDGIDELIAAAGPQLPANTSVTPGLVRVVKVSTNQVLNQFYPFDEVMVGTKFNAGATVGKVINQTFGLGGIAISPLDGRDALTGDLAFYSTNALLERFTPNGFLTSVISFDYFYFGSGIQNGNHVGN